MSIGSVITWIICGLIVGLVARFLVPGVRRMSLPMTAVLGIAGALVGGFLYSVVRGASYAPFTLASHNWQGWIVAILGAAILLWVYALMFPRKWWN